MRVESPERLGHHSKRARVIWHPGSTPAYSSLWITVQRFLMLNQPTLAAFTQDFVVSTSGSASKAPNAYLVGRDRCPIRLTRFARVLKEPLLTFCCCHISMFSPAVRPYLGDFALCPACLGEGFHSVLFSFAGWRECPVHHTQLWRRSFDKNIPDLCIFNELALPQLRCGRDCYDLPYSVARSPKANPDRDQAFADIADWLMAIGTRFWFSTPHIASQIDSLERFTERVSQLSAALNLTPKTPSWSAASSHFTGHPADLASARFGSMKVAQKQINRQGDPWQTDATNINLNHYYNTLLGDFKAIRRHLTHQLSGCSRYWLGQLDHATDESAIAAMLVRGGAQAQVAWDSLVWWRAVCSSDFKSTPCLASRPFWLALDGEIPTGLGGRLRSKAGEADLDSVHLWLVRWIGAAGLLAFWRAVRDAALEHKPPALAVAAKRLPPKRQDPEWSLGITAQQELILCIEHPKLE
jgi:hypothetical protein